MMSLCTHACAMCMASDTSCHSGVHGKLSISAVDVLSLQVFTWFVNTIGPEVCYSGPEAGLPTKAPLCDTTPGSSVQIKRIALTYVQKCVVQVNLHIDFTQVQRDQSAEAT